MDIYEALEKLDCLFDMLVNTGVCTDEEEGLMYAVEDAIYQFARKHEPKKELPTEFTCTCGKHLYKCGELADMSQFKCEDCEAEWLIGPQEV